MPTPSYKLHHNAADCLHALKERIRHAEKSIDLETFYFIPDNVGREVMDILLDKARNGVRVRLLCDSMGSFSLSTSMYVKEFAKTGNHIKFFNSFLPFSPNKKAIWYLRNHRRTIIIDDQILWVGSVCIGEPTKNWIETCIEIRDSGALTQAKTVFNKTWRKSHHKTFKIGNSSEMTMDSFSYITQAPLQRQRHLYNLLLRKIREAKHQIIFMTPYLIPDHRLYRTMRKAVKRGVKVTMICPKKTDHWAADTSRNGYIHNFLRKGFNIYFLPIMVHGKVAIFDPCEHHLSTDHVCNGSAIIGTLNLDNISLRYNYECAIYTDNNECVLELKKHFDSVLSQYSDSKLHIHQWEKRSLFSKIMEKVMWPFRKLF